MMAEFAIPLYPVDGKLRHVYIRGNFPITEADWVQFMTVLELFKPGLVSRIWSHHPEGTP